MNKFILGAVLASAVSLMQCSRSTENKVDDAQEAVVEDIKKQKEEVAKDLRALRDDINDKLDKVSKELEKGNIEAKKDLNDVKERLTNNGTMLKPHWIKLVIRQTKPGMIFSRLPEIPPLK